MRAAIFDMDGLLIDSEPLWRIVEKQAFRSVGIELTDAMCERTMGYRLDEVIQYWFEQRPWTGTSFEQLHDEMISGMEELISRRGRALDGVYEMLETIRERGMKMAVASSSPKILIDAVIRKLAIERYFAVTCSAADEALGKPDPAVYLTAARRLNVEPMDCVVFEDSVAGVCSAKAAGMMTIVVPAPHQFEDARFAAADHKIRTLHDFSSELLEDT